MGDPVTLTTAQVAALCGRSSQWVRMLGKAGHFQSAGHGRWYLGSILRGIISHGEAMVAKAEKGAASVRTTDARTREIEQRIAARDAELIPINEAVQALDLTARTALAEMQRLPARMGPAKAETAREVAVAAEVINAALAALTEALRTGQGLDQD